MSGVGDASAGVAYEKTRMQLLLDVTYNLMNRSWKELS
jgi:hypothetical protein